MNKHWGKAFLAVICAAVLLTASYSEGFAALFAFETQFCHDNADIAWLTDLVVKEDMSSVDGLAQRCELVAIPDYPYSETPESFAEDVDYYCALYNLNPASARVAYIYFFDLLSSNSGGAMAGEVSDDDIRIYLESVGIDYPDDADSDEKIFARALYNALISGAFSGIASGSSLEEVMVTYLASLTGVNIDELKKWMPEDSSLSLNGYISAASKLALWTNGYDVSPDSDDEDVYRLVAIMTLDSVGISADSSLSFDELKGKYTAVMLGRKYGITVDSAKLSEMSRDGKAAFYILQLIGKNAGVSIRDDNCSFEEAFELVAENSSVFELDKDEFYADVYNYELQLKYRRSSIWVYPTTYVSGDRYVVSIDINGFAVRNNYYTEVPIDADVAEQTLAVAVTVTSGDKSSRCIYYINIYQGASEYTPPTVDIPPSADDSNPFISSESLVAQIMSSVGVDYSDSSVISGSIFALTSPLVSMISYIVPTFDGSAELSASDTSQSYGSSVLSDEQYKEVLDQIGNISDVNIRGIDGTELNAMLKGDLSDYITFE